jgi:hypothetical protein
MNDKIKQPLGNQSFNWRHIIWFLAVWIFLIFLFRGFAPATSTREISYLDALADELLKHETLSHDEVDKILAGVDETVNEVGGQRTEDRGQ